MTKSDLIDVLCETQKLPKGRAELLVHVIFDALEAALKRGERIERNFAHQFDTGGLDRLYVRGLDNVHKKFLIQAAACNLALLMRLTYGSGKPRAAHDRADQARVEPDQG